MKITRPYLFPILWLLVFCLLTAPMTTFGYVWCVSADGHAAVEAALADDCGLVDNLDHTADDVTGVGLAAGTDDCGPCLDVALSHQMGTPRLRQNEIPDSVTIAFAPFITGLSLQVDWSLANRPHFAPRPRTPDPILYHRTIVLLI